MRNRALQINNGIDPHTLNTGAGRFFLSISRNCHIKLKRQLANIPIYGILSFCLQFQSSRKDFYAEKRIGYPVADTGF